MMKKILAVCITAIIASALIAGTALAAGKDGLMRVVIKGTDVNLRWWPSTKDNTSKASKANTGDTFIAETVEVEAYGSRTDRIWYRLICPVNKIADGWTPRMVSARFAEKKPLTSGDVKKLASLSYGTPSKKRTMRTAQDHITHGPVSLARDLADFASRYGGEAESFYTDEFPGMISQHAYADGIEVFFRQFADKGGLYTGVYASISRKGLSMGGLTVGKTSRDEAKSILGEPDDTQDRWDEWSDSSDAATLKITYDPRGIISNIDVTSDL